MKREVVVKSHKRKAPIWINGGRGKMTTVSVPFVFQKKVHDIAVIIDNYPDFDTRIEKIKEILISE